MTNASHPNRPPPPGYDRRAAARALRFLTLGLGIGVGLAGLAAPPLYNLLVALGRHQPAWSGLRELTFGTVAARCGLIGVALSCAALFRRGRLGTRHQLGLGAAGGPGEFLRWAALGWITMAGVYLAGVAAGAYRVAAWDAGEALAAVAAAAVGAVLVGFIEEVAFRGLLYGAARVFLGAAGAAVSTSLLFSLIHFADPVPYVSVAHAAWYDGWALLGTLFRFVHAADHYLPFAATLAVMGLALCGLYERRGNLAACIGLHAGWVAGLFGLKELIVREPGVAVAWFGAGDNPSYGWGAFWLIAAWWAGVARLRGGANAAVRRRAGN